jgi:hypothetical protein
MLLERAIARSQRRQKKIDRWIAKAAKANPEFAATLERVRVSRKNKPELPPLPTLSPDDGR